VPLLAILTPLFGAGCGDDVADIDAEGDSAAASSLGGDNLPPSDLAAPAGRTRSSEQPSPAGDDGGVPLQAPPPGPEAVDILLAELQTIAAESAAARAEDEASSQACTLDDDHGKSGCLGEGGESTFIASWQVDEHTKLNEQNATLKLTVSNALPIPWTVKGRARVELAGGYHDTEWLTTTLQASATTTLEIDLAKPLTSLSLGSEGGYELAAKQSAPGVVYVSLDATTQLPEALLRPTPDGEPWTVEALAELAAKGELGAAQPLQEYIPVPNLRISTNGETLDVFSEGEAARLLLEAPIEEAIQVGYAAASVERHRAIANDPVLQELIGGSPLPVMVTQWAPPAPPLDGTTAVDEENGQPRTDLSDPSGVEPAPLIEDEEVMP
jgi:hypothetical protein